MTIQLIEKATHHLKYARYTENTKAAAPTYGHRGVPIIVQQLVAGCALLVLSPLLLLVMLLIRLESPGSIFFSQVRVGEYGRHFKMYKFRSMYLPSDPRYREPDPSTSSREGVCKKYIDDPRITRIGRFIRKYSIDELPQLLNVVTRDMCLVGPRPALAIETYQYDEKAQARLFSKPGLTGLWQVSGRADTTFEQQLRLDVAYITQQSVWMDCKIILLTIPAVISARGAY
jgi:lipopolysaccharide/colanic/teichoic acid biosynthesis glycosyltransferase